MTKLLYSATMSLDGFIAGPGGDMQLIGNSGASKQPAGDSRYVNVLGADVARLLIEAGELDEVLRFVAPVLLGDGVRMFEHAGGDEASLRPLDASGTHTLWLEILRDWGSG